MIEEITGPALETGKSISEFGMLAITAGFFLVISAALMIACFRFFIRTVNDVMGSQKETLTKLLQATEVQTTKLSDISEGLFPETQNRIKIVSNALFDSAAGQVCHIVDKVRKENHIKDKEATLNKITTLVTNLHENINTKFDCFPFRGHKISLYTRKEWTGMVIDVVIGEIYNELGENSNRTYTNVDAVYSKIKLEFYHNMMEV